MSGFEELERRVVVEWGKGTRSWVQWPKKDKEVVEVLAKGQALPLFDDYLNFTLTHSELSYLYYDPEANREWRSRLRAVAGVYLILATIRGEQYVGSAYGIDVIWGRWSAYATDGHGGNKLLRDLISRDPSYPAAFSYSILQILPSTTVRTEVLRHEARYKEKLGSRAKRLSDDAPGGLNAN